MTSSLDGFIGGPDDSIDWAATCTRNIDAPLSLPLIDMRSEAIH